MSNPLQQTLPANAPSAFGSAKTEGVKVGGTKIESQYKFGLAGSPNKSNAQSMGVRTAKPRFFDKPENRGSGISRSSQMKVTGSSRP